MMAEKMPGPGSNTLTVISPETLKGIQTGRLDVNCKERRDAKLLCTVGNVQNIRVTAPTGKRGQANIKASVGRITIVAEPSQTKGPGSRWTMKKLM